jgi:hypothetical protein
MERSANARRRYGPTLIAIALLAVLIALLCTVCVPMRVSAAVRRIVARSTHCRTFDALPSGLTHCRHPEPVEG